MFYPYIAYYLFEGKPELAGIFLGTSINDTAQVSAAGYIYSQIDMKDTGLNASITTKLLRNSFLIILIPLIAFISSKEESHSINGSVKKFFPLFVIGFIMLSLIRSLGDYLIIDSNTLIYWDLFINSIKEFSKYCIFFAMVSLGLQTDIRSIILIGSKPLFVGLIASLAIGSFSIIFLKSMV